MNSCIYFTAVTSLKIEIYLFEQKNKTNMSKKNKQTNKTVA